MSLIPAYCSNCRLMFGAHNFIAVAPGANVTIRMAGNTYSCPRCGHPAAMLDGKYEALNGDLKIVESWGPMKTEHVREIMRRLGEITPDNAIATLRSLEEQAPEVFELPTVKSLMSNVQNRENRAEVYSLLALILAIIDLLFK